MAGASLPASKLATDFMPVLVQTMAISPMDGLDDTTACDKDGAMAANSSAALAIQFHSLSRLAQVFIVARF